MAAGIGVEQHDSCCSAFDWSLEARQKSDAWFVFVQAFKREHNITHRFLTSEEFIELDLEFLELIGRPVEAS